MKNIFISFSIILLFQACSADSVSSASDSGGQSGSGRGGSLARFTIANNHLYVVDNSSIKTIDISNTSSPQLVGSTSINAFAETIFPFKNNLLIGTRTGMYIFELSNPRQPKQLSVYTHFASCDPVVAEGNYAYVTLRNGTPCQRGINQLDVLDISNPSSPQFLKSYQMKNPHGLGVNGNLLFLTEGDNGLKVLDIKDPLNIKAISFLEDIKSFDVIPLNNNLIVTGKDGIYQYGYNALGALNLLSKMAVEK